MSIKAYFKIIIFMSSIFLLTASYSQKACAEEMEPKALFEKRCSKCHSLNKINRSESEEGWKTIVNKMKKKFFSGISDEDAAIIIEYLTNTKGLPAAPNISIDKNDGK